MTQARTARVTNVSARAYRRPCRKRSSSGPMTGAITENGSMVTARYSATRDRASPTGTEKNTVVASDSSTSASPAAETACRPSTLASPDSPAPCALAAAATRRAVARPARTVPRRAAREAIPARPTAPARAEACSRGAERSSSTPPSCRVGGHGRGGPGGLFAARCRGGRIGVVPTDIETDPQATTAETGPRDPESVAPAVRTRRTRSATADAVLVAAADVARDAALEVAERNGVGEHLGSTAEGDRVLTHLFACTSPGYRGWRWAVTVARAPRSRMITLSEVNLLPGPDSVVAPAWVPWADRIAPGDVAPGTVLPLRVDDPLLEPGFEATGEEDVDQVALFELGLGRPRVLSREGREAAAQRWYDGSHGPHDPHAEQAPAQCRSCGYFVPMAGALRQVFGVCASEWSPFDGAVVSLDHGCGAHSEADVETRPDLLDAPVLDELGYEHVQVARTSTAAGQVQQSVEPPLPMPSPEPLQPEPMPQPGPEPMPQPGPEPMPQPGPEPMPQPGPGPLPPPGPGPMPQPQPEPLPGTTEPGTATADPDGGPGAAPPS